MSNETKLNIGDNAPDFRLPDQNDKDVSLNDLKGKWVILYFYPKDNTPGCTVEAVDFTALADQFDALNTAVIGMSPDSVRSHDNFTSKQNLKVILASDPEKETISAYGVWQEKMNYGKKYMGVVRTTYLIGEDGTVLQSWTNVRAKGHAQAVLDATRDAG